MSIVFTQRGKKKHATSSYFKDLSVLRSSEIDTNYRQLYREKKGDQIPRLQLAYAVQKLILFKKGCQELSDYARKLSQGELDKVVTDYVGSDYEEYTGPIDFSESEPQTKPLYKTSGDL